MNPITTVFDKVAALFGREPKRDHPDDSHGLKRDCMEGSDWNKWNDRKKEFEKLPPAIQTEVTRAQLAEAAQAPEQVIQAASVLPETTDKAPSRASRILAMFDNFKKDKKKDLTSNNETAQSNGKETNMGIISDVIKGKGDGDKPMTRNELGDALSVLDAKLDPLLALAGKEAEQQASKRAEQEALKALNEVRAKQGKEPYPEDEDDGDEEKKDSPKVPGKHEKKDARIAKLERTVAGMQKLLEQGGATQGADALAIDALNGNAGHRKVLKTTGREISMERSWAFVMGQAPIMRRGIALTGSQQEVNEFDKEVNKIRMELADTGIPQPKTLDELEV